MRCRSISTISKAAGKKKSKGRGKGNPWLAGTLGRTVFGFSRSDCFLGARYRRLAKRRGPQKAIVAAGSSLLTVVYHLLSDPNARFHDLGADYCTTRIDKDRQARNLARHLEAITGQKLTIHDGQVIIHTP
ncbi:hypothetical protein AB0J35_60930 [Nonomuraea angiospora]|uniref:hypothetical protein n=1 Tax=Nonomuraea angiospora TaxID=46172 RepID=UPI0034423D4B